jgi:release factor glutamine methyltransferase
MYPDRATGETSAGVVATLRAAGCVFAEEEATILTEAAAGPDELAAMVRKRVEGRPLEHIVGWVEFGGRRIAVQEGVFVPRRRSELLVREVVSFLRGRTGLVVVDLCCGCGAIGVAIAGTVPGVEVYSVDIDPVAVRCAARNLAPCGGRALQGDLFTPWPPALRGRVDVLVGNAPYVPSGAIALMPPEARDHEPAVALDGGPDGTDILRRIIAGAPEWLAPGGMVLVELGQSQIPRITEALADARLPSTVVADEESGGIVARALRTEAGGRARPRE